MKHQKENAPYPQGACRIRKAAEPPTAARLHGPKRKNASAGRSAQAQTSCRRRGMAGCPARQSGTETRCPWGNLQPGEVWDTFRADFRCRWPVVDGASATGGCPHPPAGTSRHARPGNAQQLRSRWRLCRLRMRRAPCGQAERAEGGTSGTLVTEILGAPQRETVKEEQIKCVLAPRYRRHYPPRVGNYRNRRRA